MTPPDADGRTLATLTETVRTGFTATQQRLDDLAEAMAKVQAHDQAMASRIAVAENEISHLNREVTELRRWRRAVMAGSLGLGAVAGAVGPDLVKALVQVFGG